MTVRPQYRFAEPIAAYAFIQHAIIEERSLVRADNVALHHLST